MTPENQLQGSVVIYNIKRREKKAKRWGEKKKALRELMK